MHVSRYLSYLFEDS